MARPKSPEIKSSISTRENGLDGRKTPYIARPTIDVQRQFRVRARDGLPKPSERV